MTASAPRRVAVMWSRFGPYHLARLRAAHRRLAARGAELVAVEVAPDDALYPWQRQDGVEPFRRVRALEEGAAETTSPTAVRRAVTAALDAVDADAVAFPSYSTPDARAALSWCRRHRRAAVMLFDSRADDAPRSAFREAAKRVLVAQADAAVVAGTASATYLAALGMDPKRTFRPLDSVSTDSGRATPTMISTSIDSPG